MTSHQHEWATARKGDSRVTQCVECGVWWLDATSQKADGDWDPRVDSGGRHADHPDFGKDSIVPFAMSLIAFVLSLIAVLAAFR